MNSPSRPHLRQVALAWLGAAGLAAAALTTLERRLGPALGSDHRTLHVRLGWSDGG